MGTRANFRWGVAGAAVIAAGLFGVGMAAAAPPNLSGQTYGKAVEQIKSWGATPVIATVVGDQLATDDCVVTNSAKASNLDSSGRSRGSQILLNLNCNAVLAGPGKPGNSAATPEGQAALADANKINGATAYDLKSGVVPWCGQSEANTSKCEEICSNSGRCTDEVLKYLASL